MQAIAEKILQAADVVGDTGHDAAGIAVVIEIERQSVQVPVDLAAHIEGDLLAKTGQDIGADGAEDIARDIDQQ